MYPYAYALQDALHGQSWFAFGQKLPQLAQTLSNLSRRCAYIIETDYSKFDGTVSELARQVERAVYLSYFPTHKMDLESILSAEIHQTIRIKGNKYDSGFSRSSGAPDTCLMNSILNLFVGYIVLGPDAFNIAVFGGDDGVIFVPQSRSRLIVGNTCPAIVAASKSIGLNIKCVVREHSQTYSFLARTFMPGDPNSTCQPERLMPKLHVLGFPNIPEKFRVSRLRMKLENVLQSDRNTPFVGPLIAARLKAVAHDRTPVPISMCSENAWWDRVLDGGPWPNESRPWMLDYVSRIIKPNGDLIEKAVVCGPKRGVTVQSVVPPRK